MSGGQSSFRGDTKFGKYIEDARTRSSNGQKMANPLKSVRYSGVNGQNMENLLKSVRYPGVNGQKMANPLKFVRYPSVNGQKMANPLKYVHNLCSPSQSASHYMLEINFHLLTKIHLKGVLLMKHIQTPYDIGDKQKFANRKLSQSKYD